MNNYLEEIKQRVDPKSSKEPFSQMQPENSLKTAGPAFWPGPDILRTFSGDVRRFSGRFQSFWRDHFTGAMGAKQDLWTTGFRVCDDFGLAANNSSSSISV
jgi:hypothetical protein